VPPAYATSFDELPPTSPLARLWANRRTRAYAISFGVLLVFSLARIIADAPELTVTDTFAATVGGAAPILLAALGGLFSERAGVVNIGLDGMMTLGTWAAGWAGWHYGPYAALVAGLLGGALGGLLHALATVTFGVDHIVSGVAINVAAPGVTRFLSSEVFVGHGDGSISNSPTMHGTIGQVSLPFVSGGKFFGWGTPDPLGWLDRKRWFLVSDLAGFVHGLTSRMAWSTVLAIALVPLSAYVLWRTRFGLRLRSVGEKPSAADSLGVPVYRMKYIAVTISGALAGLGGAWLAIDVRRYSERQTAGRGFTGLAALVFGNYRPSGIAGGAGLFSYVLATTQRVGTKPVLALVLIGATGFAVFAIRQFVTKKPVSGLGIALLAVLFVIYYSITDKVNSQFVYMAPYVVTLVVLAFASQRLRPPAADGKPWRKGMDT
jgi:general nucleoside transport system permease protein